MTVLGNQVPLPTDFSSVNKNQLAAAFNVDPKTITKWQHMGLPHTKPEAGGEANAYSLPECIKWYVRFKTKDGLDLDAERAKVAKEDAERKRRENEIEAGKVITVEAAKMVTQRAASAIRQVVRTSAMTEQDKQRMLVAIHQLKSVDFETIEDDEEDV